jgi:hypothetical protein
MNSEVIGSSRSETARLNHNYNNPECQHRCQLLRNDLADEKTNHQSVVRKLNYEFKKSMKICQDKSKTTNDQIGQLSQLLNRLLLLMLSHLFIP